MRIVGIRVVILMAVLAGVGFSATKYVDIYDGAAHADNLDDGSSATNAAYGEAGVGPMTLKQAMAESGAGNIYTLADGTYTYGASPNDWTISSETPATPCHFVSTDGADGCIIAGSATATNGIVTLLNSSNIHFENITITDSGLGAGVNACTHIRSSATAVLIGIEFTGCIFTASKSAGYCSYIIANSTGKVSVSFTNCNFTTSGGAFGLSALAGDVGTISISGGTWTSTNTGTTVLLNIAGADTSCTVTGVTMTTSETGSVITLIPTVAAGSLTFTNNTITVTGAGATVVNIKDFWTGVTVSGNIITSTDNANSANFLLVGDNDPPAAGAMTGPILIHDNIVTFSGTTALAEHGYLIGDGADGTRFYNNTCLLPAETGDTAVNIGLVIKQADNCVVYDNYLSGSRALYFKGASNNNTYRNFLRANEKYCVYWATGATEEAANNIVKDSIFDATKGTYCIYGGTTGTFNNRFTNNTYYYLGKAVAGYVSGDTYNTLALLKAGVPELIDSRSDTKLIQTGGKSTTLNPSGGTTLNP